MANTKVPTAMVEITDNATPRLYTTGEVIKKSGISRQMLYQYTALGLVEEAQRTEQGHRLYLPDVFQHLKIIRDLNASGYPLKHIKEIFFSKGGVPD